MMAFDMGCFPGTREFAFQSRLAVQAIVISPQPPFRGLQRHGSVH